ncbi:MAG: BACON domain-containing protein [Alistipes sp.]|nr:BACON domain-containing protein [Alistipes sp.]
MKRALYNIIKLAIVAVLALPVGSCQKPYEMDLPLAVSRAKFTVKREAGQIFFIVYSQDKWTAEFETPVTWAQLSRTSGGNQTQVNVSYDENSDLSRGVNIIIRSGNLTKKVYLSQNAGISGDISYSLEHQALTLLKEPFSVELAAVSNVPAANMDIAVGSVNYVNEGDEWIQNINITAEKVTFDVSENSTGQIRQAIVTITFPVAEWDTPITTMVVVTQNATPASFGAIPSNVAADPNGITPLAVELQPNFTPALYGFRVEYSVAYAGDVQNWLRNLVVDTDSYKFVAEPKPNPYPERTATATFKLLDASGKELDLRNVVITQAKSDMGITDGGNDTGEEPKDPEEDF